MMYADIEILLHLRFWNVNDKRINSLSKPRALLQFGLGFEFRGNMHTLTNQDITNQKRDHITRNGDQ